MRIIYLDLDSMRPDHMGAYGYHRPITPNLDRLVRGGVRFGRCFAQASPCVPSRAAMFSGRFDVHTGVVTHWGPGSTLRGALPTSGLGAGAAPMLARHLFANGYRTVSFSSFPDRHNAWWFCAGWTEMITTGLKRGNERADEVNEYVLPWLRAHAVEPDYFLHIQYWDPHRNYRMPPEYLDRVRGTPPPAWPDAAAIAEHRRSYGPFTARELWPFRDGRSPREELPDEIATVDDWRRWVDGYDASIAYMDDHVGQILDELERAGTLDETTFIVSADHAEAMGEGAVYGDHCNAMDAVQNIPLAIAWPGVTRPGTTCDDLVYNVDLAPTVCEMIGASAPDGWDGRSLVPQLRGETADRRTHLVYSHGLYTCQRVVRTHDWALIRTFHPGLFPWDPVSLYDMRQDPRQTHNVQAQRPDVVGELQALMDDWLREEVDPLQEVVETGPFKYVQLDPWIERLRRRGRIADADEVARRAAAP